jgi:glycosyltransferase involved in cell wall biosynthesis
MSSVELSIVLIGKNQAWNMARLVESILTQTSQVGSREIIFVDSASTDETLQIAAQYPIHVLRLRPSQTLTPAAGRYVGYRYSSGSMVLFVDGDMELYPGWLEHALQALRRRPDVGAVTGEIIDLPKDASTPSTRRPEVSIGACAARSVPFAAGVAIYRRAALERAGPFNPYLQSDEEPDLCVRIRHQGFQIVRLDHPVVYHYSDAMVHMSTLVGRWRRKLYLGSGQCLRYHWGRPTFGTYYQERGYGVMPLAGILLGFVSLMISLARRGAPWFRIWLLCSTLFVAVDALRKRSLYRALRSLLERLFLADGTLRGFFMDTPEPDTYPADLDVIQWIGQPVERLDAKANAEHSHIRAST